MNLDITFLLFPLKEEKKWKPLSWNDLRNSLTIPRRSESISICGQEPEVRAPTFLAFQELQDQEEKTQLSRGADKVFFPNKGLQC